MSQKQHLRFSVEESVWFQKGQEVSELLSISLEPDIAIHEHEQYISIRGALQLTGEYKIDNEAEEHDQFNFANVRYVNEVQTREDGISIINHRFPVDITIPSNRIENLDEVYVSIESFDYEMPELKCLKLVADLSISGILNDQPQSTEAEDEEGERQEEAVFEALFRGPQSQTWDAHEGSSPIQTNTTHPFSSFYQEEETTGEDVDKLSPLNIKPEEVREEEKEVELLSTTSQDDLEVAAIGSEIVEESQEDEQEEDWQDEEQEGQQDEQEDLYNPFVVEVRKEEQETVEPKEVQYSFFSKSEDPASGENQAESVEVTTREEEEPKDSHYLTSLFAREGEDDFSRLKMCIVQQGDTLELICERYELSVQQILRVNDLQANQDVYEGQILYIPSLSTSK
ncbi:stage VI sporulation protein D [Metabacillus litoralis]|uniref:stage VI sporulation protein D n=1 Tax=Metabacillus litoralis TaxID=152268 RepID=UPI00203E795B|nr:stage VI sporulation protein D [Metabacillus litoralis]MCM3650642.1 stage VI sporulation protein D [Metabacillus litoralis]